MNGQQAATDKIVTDLHELQGVLWREFRAALEHLGEISGDFTEGSQQRWMITSRALRELRDQLYFMEQRLDAIEQAKGGEAASK